MAKTAQSPRARRSGEHGEIAKRAGIGRATLYRYFATRDELLEAMVPGSARELAAP